MSRDDLIARATQAKQRATGGSKSKGIVPPSPAQPAARIPDRRVVNRHPEPAEPAEQALPPTIETTVSGDVPMAEGEEVAFIGGKMVPRAAAPKILADITSNEPSSLYGEHTPPQTEQQSPEVPATRTVEPASSAGGFGRMIKCPHCEWELSIADGIVPSENQKNAFKTSWIMGVPFVDTQHWMDGEVEIQIRGLTYAEWREIEKYVKRWEEKNPLKDSNEAWMLCHIVLQVLSVRTPKWKYEAPDGLIQRTSKTAQQVWLPTVGDDELDDGDWDAIITTAREDLERSENIFRMLDRAVANFNRLSLKLEVMLDRGN